MSIPLTAKKLSEVIENPRKDDDFLSLIVGPGAHTLVYPHSINRVEDTFFFMFRDNGERFLGIVDFGSSHLSSLFQGNPVAQGAEPPVKKCPLSPHNADLIRQHFRFTKPRLIGLEMSYGLGDRLGLANPGHLRAIKKTAIQPILAQQSIRELERTQRTPEEVMDAASWAVFQEGYKSGFGADGDHLKTVQDIDLVLNAGFTMLTFDPGDFVVNEADRLGRSELLTEAERLPWADLQDTLDSCLKRYADMSFRISDSYVVCADSEAVLRALVKYGQVLSHVNLLHRHLKSGHSSTETEIELSIDETESVTTPFEHYLIVNELRRLGVEIVGLAPRFVGDFEKGVDYRGDIETFRSEYLKHVQISEALGPYKLSLHSGSDKFRVYDYVGSLEKGHTHVKTAGTSYLEALRAVAEVEVDLFRTIYSYSRSNYEVAKATYHVSANLSNVPAEESLSNQDCVDLFASNDDARQVLHVNFGGVLTTKNPDGTYLFRDQLLRALKEHEDVHYRCLIAHFKRHFDPFVS